MKKQLLLFVTMLMAVIMPMKLWAADGNAEPYAVLTGDTLLTFFYDDQKAARNGMDVRPVSSSLDVPWFNRRNRITSAEFDPSFANCTSITSTAYWFEGCSNLTSISYIQYLNTVNVTDMSYMFLGCSSLTSLDVREFNTANVTNMHCMFYECSSLTSLDVSGFNTTNVTAMGDMFSGCSGLTSLDVGHFNTGNVTYMGNMFSGCSGLTSLDVTNFNTDNVTSMSEMFENCLGLTSLDVSHFNTANVTNMDAMFTNCSGLTSLDVSHFNTDNVTDMHSMFSGCSGLTSIDVSGFNTTKVTNMDGMFAGCSGLTSLDVTNFNTENVTTMITMFSGCSSLTTLDVSHFNTDKVTDMSSMFYGCSSLTSLDVSGFNTGNVTNMLAMFDGCSGLTILDLSSFNTVNVTRMFGLFSGCSSLKTIYVGSLWTTNAVMDSYIFWDCTSLVGGAGTTYDANHTDYTYAHIDGGENNPGYFTDVKEKPEAYVVPSGDDTGVSTLTFYYDNQKESRSGWMPMGQDGSNITWTNYSQSVVEVIFDDSFANCTTITSTSKWFNEFLGLKAVTGLSNLKTDHVTDMSSMFNNCWALTNLDLSSLNTANVTDMSFMVLNCYNLTNLNVSGFNTSNVTNMSHMFAACSQLTNLDVSGFNTEKVTNMDSMFEGCAGLTSLDVSGFNTANVTNMSHMFSECLGLTGLNVGGFNTANVTNMRYLFSGCTSLTSLDVGNFNTANVTKMEAMFSGCSSLTTLNVGSFNTTNVTEMGHVFGNCSLLTSLDLSNFNTSNVTRIQGMFDKDSLLTSIYVGSEWSIENVTEGNNVFRDCISLVGGAGTAYDANHTDHTYAHIDGGTANPGYFTAKDGQDDPLLARLYDNLALTTTDGNADGGNNDLSGSIDAAQTSLVRAMWNLQELPTDESYCVWMDSGIPALNTNTWSNSTQTQSMMGLYARLYHGIILANNYLANQNDGDLGKQAEARFLRALQYYYLMDHFGNVPLLTDTIDRQPLPVWEATPRDIELPTRVEMFNYIESELQDCLNSLPAANSYGRATTTAARLLLARLYLNSEVYTGTARWQEARSYAESVINGGTFQLAPIYRNLFMGDNDSNGAQQEIILPAIYDANTRTDYGGTTFLVASSFANGEGDNGTTQVWAGNVSKPDFVNKFFTQTADIPYASPEQTASAANDDRALFYGINHSYELRNGDSFSDGFPYQKFTNVRSNGTSPVSSKFADTDFPLMRLGEAYLIAAEADARLNGSATSMQGTQYINMLRNRANAAASTTGYSLSDICDEWSREMGYEAVRRTTLIRFGRFGGQADYSWAWKGGSYDGSAFDAAKNTYPIPAVAVGGTPEPYAVLSENDTKLTFFYDTDKDARGGMSVGPFDLNNYPSWYNQRESITTVEFDDSFANCTTLTSTAFWFYNCGKITSIIGISNLKTDNVMNMGWMFSGCSGLTGLSVSGFNTANVKNMDSMFYGCSGLTSLDVSNFNTVNVDDMLNMFYGCSSITTLDVSRFNTANVTVMSGMFQNCSALTTIDVSNFNTDKVTGMTSMFADCSSLTSLDVSNFNTANVNRMGSMFQNCSSVTSLDVRRFNTANVTDMGQMFSNCSSLTSLNVSGFKTDNVTEMRYMFYGCSGLTSLDVSRFNTANVTNMVGMFSGCSALTSLGVSGFNTDNVTSMNSMFENCSGLNAIDISNFNTANVKYMDGVFRGCSGLTSLDVSRFNTENVTAMRYMFYGCSSLTSLDVTNFKTDHVTSMQWMFRDCSGLTSLDVSHFNTENVVNMSYMFANCSHITSLDVSNFNTSKVTDMSSMFYGCSGLTSLNVSNFNTSNATTMTYMFGICSHITTLDLSNFNTSKVTDMNFMFKDCSALTTIFVGSEWVTSSPSATVDMFEGCTSLVGGAGTPYDENHTDYTYAHIDGGTSNPGYFTSKDAPEGEATFDGKVARVSGERTLDEAFEQRGGRAEATRTIAAIIWNKESALTESDLQGITNPNLLVYVNEARLAPSNVQNVVINGLAREIVLTDAQDGNNDWYAPQAFVAERISYTRNFAQSTTKGTSRGWESIALPFDVQTIQHESKGVIAPFNSSASNKHFWLRRLTDNGLQAATNIEANTPYIISMPNSEEYTADYNLNGRVTFSAQNIDVPATTTKVLALADSSIVMVPAMQRQSRSSSVWALNVGEVRGQYFEGSVFERDYRTVRPFEAYTVHRQENGQPAPRYVPIQEIAGTTGIETINREPLTLNQWYDMQGRKLEGKPARKGVYISNGKKVVVK